MGKGVVIASHIAKRRKKASNDLSRFYKSDMDFLARLAVLEGAAGVQVGSWVRRGDAGPYNTKLVAEVHSHFPGLDPAWTSPKNSGMLPKSLQKLSRTVYKFPSSANMEDRVLSAIFGYTVIGSMDKSLKFYNTGRDLAAKIQKGAGPEVAIRWLSYTLYQFSVEFLRSHKWTDSLEVEGEDGSSRMRPQVEVFDGYSRQSPLNRVFNIIVTPSDPLAAEFIALMREAWAPRTPKGQDRADMMETWLRMTLRDRGVPTPAEVADELGIPKNTFEYNFKVWLQDFSSLIAKNPNLVDKLKDKANRRAKRLRSSVTFVARFEDGTSVDVEQWLRDRGNDEAADEWAANTEKYKNKFKEARTASRRRYA